MLRASADSNDDEAAVDHFSNQRNRNMDYDQVSSRDRRSQLLWSGPPKLVDLDNPTDTTMRSASADRCLRRLSQDVSCQGRVGMALYQALQELMESKLPPTQSNLHINAATAVDDVSSNHIHDNHVELQAAAVENTEQVNTNENQLQSCASALEWLNPNAIQCIIQAFGEAILLPTKDGDASAETNGGGALNSCNVSMMPLKPSDAAHNSLNKQHFKRTEGGPSFASLLSSSSISYRQPPAAVLRGRVDSYQRHGSKWRILVTSSSAVCTDVVVQHAPLLSPSSTWQIHRRRPALDPFRRRQNKRSFWNEIVVHPDREDNSVLRPTIRRVLPPHHSTGQQQQQERPSKVIRLNPTLEILAYHDFE